MLHIISRCQKFDQSAQKELYSLTSSYVNAIIRRYLIDRNYSDDMMQDIFIKVFSRIGSFDPSKGEIKSWIAKLSINTIYDFNKKNTDRYNDYSIENLSIEYNAVAVFELEKEDLFKLIDKMPLTLKLVFNMSVVDGLSHEEIGQILNCTSTVSRKRLSRARSWLKEIMFKATNESK